MQFLPHLVATNDVFLALAGDEWNWDRLPFVWRGSHRARIEFVDLTGGEAATPFRRRQRVLAPDAIVTPRRGLAGPRCFVELDRSTECISPKPGRTSITGKLRAYRKLTEQVVPEHGCTAYERRFRKDPRSLRLVFVLTSTDPSERRARSIMQAVQEGLPRADVHCVSLRDTVRLRALMLPPGAAVVPQAREERKCRSTFELTVRSATDLRDFFVAAAPVLRRASFERQAEREQLSALAGRAREVLLRAKAVLFDGTTDPSEQNR